jgi:phenylalanyl-tRNA synthetase beta chain
MNHVGLAREIAVLFDRPLQVPSPRLQESDEATSAVASVAIENLRDCPRYVARVLKGVQVGPSPSWLVDRLESVGVRAINNIVDISNYVLWELGQPIHAFDLDKLSRSQIVVRRAEPGERLVTLDGEARQLNEQMLVIADAERAVALAGVMGGLDSEVSSSTVNLLIESAHFNPARVRQTAKLLGLHTDASHRFERGADPEICRLGADRVAELVAELAGGLVLVGAVDAYDEELDWTLSGHLDWRRLNRFAGTEVDREQLARWLEGLGFGLQEADGWTVRSPSWRYYDFKPDPEVAAGRDQAPIWESDLFEEAMRLHGYANVPSELPALAGPDGGSSEGHVRREQIRWHLAACGYVEAVTYSFHDRSADTAYPALRRAGEALHLANPLSELYSVMQRSLVPGLVEAAIFNQRRGADAVRLFEIGHVFPGGDEPEFETVALAAGGSAETPWNRREEFDLFDLKGAVMSLTERFNVTLRCAPTSLPGLMEGTACELRHDGAVSEVVGYLGCLDGGSFPYPVFVAELITAVLASIEPKRVSPPSRHPSVAVDLTLTHGQEIPWREIEQEITDGKSPELFTFGLKDRYRGSGVPEGAVNTTIYFLYNAEDRSLTQEEVNERHEALRQRLEGRFGWKGQS